ncbi:MAG: RNA polymerase sigma factor [Parabacteroides sp.]|nr:RNA polymerase sigma factor [Parabacteroides sp.]
MSMKKTNTYLIEACRKGDRTAQLALYKAYARWLYNICFRIVGNVGDAEEAMQDAFLKILTRIDLYQEEQTFEAWIHSIAIHTAIDHLRRQTPDWEELTEQLWIPEEERENEEEVQYSVEQIKRACKELPPGYRVILSLYLFEGYDMEEIASILKIQPASVRSQYLRGKRKLLNIIAAKESWTN